MVAQETVEATPVTPPRPGGSDRAVPQAIGRARVRKGNGGLRLVPWTAHLDRAMEQAVPRLGASGALFSFPRRAE